MEREVLSSSPWDPVPGHVGTVQSCIRGGSDLTVGTISLPRGWSNTGTGLPREVVDALCLSVFKRHLDNALNNML